MTHYSPVTPAVTNPPRLPARGGAPRPPGALLVDDDKLMLAVLADMLRDLGVRDIETAVNGTTAIAALDRMSTAPGLVFCDLNMPGRDGFEFMKDLGERGYAGEVIVISGMNARTMNSASLMARFHRLNIAALLNKPVLPAALRSALGLTA